ncbi:MAG: hypothetical protein JWN75_211 [Candidatus Saccharibacteria bacterium]|nr:hypothetical protein [Candidatus Saccharibacteria bacterium]
MNWVLVFIIVDYLLRFVVLGLPKINDTLDSCEGKYGLYIFPGVLGESFNQIGPIRDVFSQYGRLFYGKIGRVIYSPTLVKRRFARQIELAEKTHGYDKGVLVGISLGACIALDVNDQRFENNPNAEKYGLIVFDGVAGSKNLLSGGNIFAPIFRVLRWMIPIGLISGLIIGMLIMIPQGLWINQGPKDEEIEDGLDKEQVKKKAKRDMFGYLPGVFARQLVHIAASEVNAERLSRFAWIQYYQYDWKNVTVNQPGERLKWQEIAREAEVPFDYRVIDAPHVAFAQMPTVSRKALSQGLPRFLEQQDK